MSAPTDWGHRFARLGPAFYTELPPTPLPAPHWIAHSRPLARELGLDEAWLRSEEALHTFSGNRVLPGMRPLASVYSGHQFGQWADQLGDGRALFLGELPTAHPDPTHARWEIQLKGAGRTPYSRMGDGRAVLRSSIREFLASEAMHALGVPTTRALCLTGSPAPVQRETVETAAVVTRAAPSFIRFGHFEHFSHRGQHTELRALADFVIDHFYPECRHADGNPYANLLQSVASRTAELLAQWQAVGFCHGVMNTDNMSVLGLTLDYGPFQFMDGFDPHHICNHSDTQGRYAYARQPNVAYWNLFCLGQALLPLMDDQQQALDALEPYKTEFPAALQRRMNAKLDLSNHEDNDPALTEALMQALARERVDMTIFFRRLSHAAATLPTSASEPAPMLDSVRDLFRQHDAIDAWLPRWQARLQRQLNFSASTTAQQMLRTNPHIVLRNHLGETVIQHAQQGDFAPLHRLQHALQTPYDALPDHDDLADFPPDWAQHIAISCSS